MGMLARSDSLVPKFSVTLATSRGLNAVLCPIRSSRFSSANPRPSGVERLA
jgi:hypothetical protein